MRKDKGLSPFHALFVQHYLVSLNPSEALGKAGSESSGRARTNIAWKILQRADVQAAIAEKQAILADELHLDARRVLEEYLKVGMANMVHYLATDGTISLPMDRLTRMAAISEYTVDVIERGDNPVIVRTKLKLHSKLGALDSLARHLNLFKDGAADPKEQDTGDMSSMDIARKLLFALRVAAGEASKPAKPDKAGEPSSIH